MAKMYRHPEGGAFYDAFGGKIGEVEEVWAGDSFDRAAIDCYCSASNAVAKTISAEPATLNFTVKDCEWDPNTLASLKGEIGVYTPGTVEFVCNSNISTLSDTIAKLQEQIDALKQTPCATTELRAALKTLKYKREVE